jgi:hypothetical protein
MTVVPQLPYSPDFAPADFFFLFPKLKSTLKGRQFQMIEERKFATGPTRYPAKHVPELVKTLEVLY